MSVLERRLQILIDRERFARLEAESRETGRSIGSIVRAAIDLHFDSASADAARAAAAHRLLEATSSPAGAEPAWAESKAAILDDAELREPGSSGGATSPVDAFGPDA